MSSGREKFNKYKVVINSLVKIIAVFPRFIRVFIWDVSSRYSQVVFVGLRYIILKSLIKTCGDNVKIGPNVQIIEWQNLSIGDNVSIHANSYIDATGNILINDNVSIAHNSTILSSNHTWDNLEVPIKYNAMFNEEVIIETDVWIGCGCRILAGVHISKRSVVAAGAVVVKNIESNSIVGGVPAKLIKKI